MQLFSTKKININRIGCFSAGETARKIGISTGRLRYWEKLGIVRPKILFPMTKRLRSYSGEDIHRAVLVKTLVENEKYTIKEAIKKLDEEKVV